MRVPPPMPCGHQRQPVDRARHIAVAQAGRDMDQPGVEHEGLGTPGRHRPRHGGSARRRRCRGSSSRRHRAARPAATASSCAAARPDRWACRHGRRCDEWCGADPAAARAAAPARAAPAAPACVRPGARRAHGSARSRRDRRYRAGPSSASALGARGARPRRSCASAALSPASSVRRCSTASGVPACRLGQAEIVGMRRRGRELPSRARPAALPRRMPRPSQ